MEMFISQILNLMLRNYLLETGGKMNSFGILTDAGYFRLTGLGARKLFDEYRYRAVMMQIECKILLRIGIR